MNLLECDSNSFLIVCSLTKSLKRKWRPGQGSFFERQMALLCNFNCEFLNLELKWSWKSKLALDLYWNFTLGIFIENFKRNLSHFFNFWIVFHHSKISSSNIYFCVWIFDIESYLKLEFCILEKCVKISGW